MAHFKMWFDDETPLMRFLYHARKLEEDLKKEQKRRAEEQQRQKLIAGRRKNARR